jgi:hypothetical protein
VDLPIAGPADDGALGARLTASNAQVIPDRHVTGAGDGLVRSVGQLKDVAGVLA